MTYYDIIAQGYDGLHGEEQIRKAKIILSQIKVKQTDTLLDVGCGSGIATVLFPCKKIGLDPAKELLKKCSFPIVVGVAENLPFSDSSFDIVISLTAIHNFTDIKKGLQEIVRVAKRNVVLSVLKKSSKYEQIKRIIESLLTVVKVVDDVHDTIFFCTKPLNRQQSKV